MSWQAEQQKDMDELERAAREALKASATRPLTEAEQMALAYSAGFANEHYINLKRHERT